MVFFFGKVTRVTKPRYAPDLGKPPPLPARGSTAKYALGGTGRHLLSQCQSRTNAMKVQPLRIDLHCVKIANPQTWLTWPQGEGTKHLVCQSWTSTYRAKAPPPITLGCF